VKVKKKLAIPSLYLQLNMLKDGRQEKYIHKETETLI